MSDKRIERIEDLLQILNSELYELFLEYDNIFEAITNNPEESKALKIESDLRITNRDKSIEEIKC